MDTSFENAGDGTCEWLTPRWIIDDLGPFDLDPCAPVKRPWPIATVHYTMEDDGLAQEWAGFVWCNPPYGSQAKIWLERLADHVGGGIALTFARTETKMFFESVWERYYGLLFVKGRLRFCRPNGQPGGTAGAPSVLIGYGERALRRLANSKIEGHLVVASAAIVIGSDGKPVGTWRQVVEDALAGRELRVRDLYRAVEWTGKVRAAKAHGVEWKSKIRRTLQEHFRPIERGIWAPA